MNQDITRRPVITSQRLEQNPGPEVAGERLKPSDQITESRPSQHSLCHYNVSDYNVSDYNVVVTPPDCAA